MKWQIYPLQMSIDPLNTTTLKLVDLSPPASTGQEWQFNISTVSSYWQMKWHISPQLLSSSGQEWQFYISTVRAHIGRSTPLSTMHHGISIMGCNWQSLWILQVKVEICFYF